MYMYMHTYMYVYIASTQWIASNIVHRVYFRGCCAHPLPPPPPWSLLLCVCPGPLERTPEINPVCTCAYKYTKTYTHNVILSPSALFYKHEIILLSQSITPPLSLQPLPPFLSLSSISSSLPVISFLPLCLSSVREGSFATYCRYMYMYIHPQLMCVSCDNHLTSFKLSGCISR